MFPVPWRQVESWNCIACGRCCRGYDVALGLNEWVNITRTFGMGFIEPRIDRLLLKKKYDGTCVFLYGFFDRQLCGLQNMKPRACKIWPFKICGNPKYGQPHESSFTCWEKKFFIYVDPLCLGIRWGTPTPDFMHKTLPEFIEISLGLREKQQYSTSRMSYHPVYFTVRGEQKFRRPPPII
jgi:Fe-S-cluster containining protein